MAGAALALAPPALADWDTGQPCKWVQAPDLSVMGIDVNANRPFILADDFQCTEEGLITGIHIWGSWRNDYLPFGQDPTAVTFTLSIHADIPATPEMYSMPGEVLWVRTFDPTMFSARVWQAEIEEGWMDPPDDYYFPADWTCWQYNFEIPQDMAFLQVGTPDDPIVYWLDVQAVSHDQEAFFGWKTSLDHWNDDAVWGSGVEPYTGPWYELIYPPNHELHGQSIDLAFVIVGEETHEELDYGDAPDSPGALGYPTLLASNGARHLITGPWLGDVTDAPDAEPDGQPDPNALGDDLLDFNDDEDGVNIPVLNQGMVETITVEVYDPGGAGGVVEAWIDWDGDSTWQHPGEQIYAGWLPSGPNAITVSVPASSVVGQTFARFRISINGGLPPDGPATDGEVEDHEVYIEVGHQDELDFGDAPDGAAAPGYPTLLANNGANHIIAGPWLGDANDVPDPELDGQPDPNALGDDLLDLNDDEDGVSIPVMQQGNPATITFQVSGGGGVVEAWIDWDGDQTWQHPAEQIYANAVADGIYNFNIGVPGTAVLGQTFARFRISTAGGLPPDGAAADGEVEDYEVYIEEAPQTYKWIQPPDLSPMGIDVNATRDYILADDFLCTQTGPITTIEIWGSWLGDYYPFMEDPEAVTFILSFHSDIPADSSSTEYSMPGDVLWVKNFAPGEFTGEIWEQGIVEGWMNPPDDYMFPADWTCWIYRFDIPLADAFVQHGSPEDSVVYWLDVQAIPEDVEAYFGWKTSFQHWNDDAVWGQGVEPYLGPWYELRYPPGHELMGQSIDLAFRLFGEITYPDDYGDAPDPTYPTLAGSGGASHTIVPGVYLGSSVDGDPDGQPDPNALGDDNDGNDDEGDVIFGPAFAPGVDMAVIVTASTAGFLDAWVDYDGSGDWSGLNEQIFTSEPLAAGSNVLTFTVPTTATTDINTFVRFRFSTMGGLGFGGPATDGEVEDYMVYIYPDLTDLPDGGLPQRFNLHQNVPNPFNPMTAIKYDLPAAGRVDLTIYTIDGRRVTTLVSRHMTAGRHTAIWDGRDDTGQPVASGTYLYHIKAGQYEQSQRMLLLK